MKVTKRICYTYFAHIYSEREAKCRSKISSHSKKLKILKQIIYFFFILIIKNEYK